MAERTGRFRRFRRILARVALALVALVAVALLAAAWKVRRSWPQAEGRLDLPGLLAPVEVIRDASGVPHIYAANDHDLLFAQGVVHAQDRLWSMDFDRRLAGGTLSELIGGMTVPLDRYLRTVGAPQAAERDWAALSPETRALIEAYCEGINAYLATRDGALPVEYTVFRGAPRPWKPLDVMVRTRLMSWLLSQNQQFETSRARMIAHLGEAKTRELLPPYRQGAPLIVHPEARGYSWLRNAELHDDLAAFYGGTTLSWGSNHWSVSGKRTATGKPMLANDTHLEMSMPSVWYHNGLHGGSFDVVGASLPGVPFVILGTNGQTAWGVTDLLPDVQDFYIEKLDDPANPRRYLDRGVWRDLEIKRETVLVRGGDPVVFDVLRTHHGPIMNDAVGRLRQLPEKLALRWSDDQPNRLLEAIAAVDRARDWDSFRAALSLWGGPHLSFGYADAAGHIGYQATGKVPIRAPGHQGLVPVPGWTGEHEWQGFIPFDEMPRLLDPPGGAVFSANNKIVGDEYPYHLAYEWSDPYRAMRIQNLLAGRDRLTLDDFAAMQSDTYSFQAEEVLPALLAVKPEGEMEKRALEIAAAWDRRNDTGSAGAAIYQVFYRRLLANTVDDELGEGLDAEYRIYEWVHGVVLADMVRRPRDPWFDDRRTAGVVEDRDAIARRSFREAVEWLAGCCGSDPAGWTWGEIHPVVFGHKPLGRTGIRLLDRLFNGPAVPGPGDRFTMNATWFSFDPERPYAADGGAGQRLMVDLGNPDNSRFIQNSGQVEQLFHPHRLDLVPVWQEGGHRPLHFTRKAVEGAAVAVLRLEPQQKEPSR